jgi:hypothetical protein
MSFDVALKCPCCDEPISVERHEEGGTYVMGGTTTAELNVTYNYSLFYFDHLDRKQGLEWLDGKKASECIERLREAVAALGAERSANYWAAKAGNAGYVLAILLKWAEEYRREEWLGLFGNTRKMFPREEFDDGEA